jgi:hypothetical protein
MAHPQHKPVWQDVEVSLEFIHAFDPEHLHRTHPGLSIVLGELLIGPPRTVRVWQELELFAGLTSLTSRLPQLRLDPPALHRLGLELDRAFGALEFDVIGRRVLSVPNPGPVILPEGWRAVSSVWLCHRPLRAA